MRKLIAVCILLAGVLTLGLAFGLAPPAPAIAGENAVYAIGLDGLIAVDIGAMAAPENKFFNEKLGVYDIANFDAFKTDVTTTLLAPRASPAAALESDKFILSSSTDWGFWSLTSINDIYIYDDGSPSITDLLGAHNMTRFPLRI